MKKIIAVAGPTASGKTKLAIELAKKLDGEVVSADAFAVYRGLDIGTAKPSMEERRGILHHMLDIAGASETYTVARYVEDAKRCTDDILSRGKVPVLAGGSGLHMDSLIRGRRFAGFSGSGTRERLTALAEAEGHGAVFELLRRHDPESALRLHPNDLRRVIRALEVFFETGETISRHNENSQKQPPLYDAVTIGLNFSDRTELYNRIDTRVDRMLELGLLSELRGLIAAGITREMPSMQAIGYKELFLYLDGEITLELAAENIKRESRRYAKRQLTWLRQKDDIFWIKSGTDVNFNEIVRVSTEYIEQNGLL